MGEEELTFDGLKKARERLREKYGDTADAIYEAALAAIEYINKIFADREKLIRKSPKGFERLHALLRGDPAGLERLQGAALKPGAQNPLDMEDALSLAIVDCLTELEKELDPTLEPLKKVVKDLQHVRNRTQQVAIDAYRKYDETRRPAKVRSYEKEKELEFGTKYDLAFSFQFLESLADISKLHEVEKISDLEKWTKTIKGPLDREIAKLNFISGLKVRAIADKLGLSKSDVDRRIQKLKKIKPPL